MNLIDQKPMIARYRLKARGFLNSISNRREFEGALIQIDGGFGCIHPWPELGDPTLDRCLADLAGARRWPIVRRAIRCAEYDRASRAFDNSLFEEMEVPASHATLAKADVAEIALAVEAGFTTVKLKTGRDLSAEAKFLDEMTTENPQLKWRLDFNESLTPGDAADFLLGLAEKTRAAIDFVEDPSPYSETAWTEIRRQTRVKLAVDREAAPLSSAAQVMVIKPAIDEPFLLGEAALGHNQRVVVTSYMDHPLGQAFAAWEAARLGLQFPGLVGICGLQTHHLFEPNEFSEALGPWSPDFKVPAGTGLGFDDLLDAQPWTRLY
ncbi:MAG: enolase C-terminal domain-like protein [Luteolibacter sp.]|uniref:enolase C-terminal domain-like protein n=1 Tax=Luteolibacter sp. TaxID=1962973 RepID=UPI0032655887